MARLRDVQVHTKITSLPSMLGDDNRIPAEDSLEVSKYAQDCHTMLFKLLNAEKIPNPNERNRFCNVSRGKLDLLYAAWENYMLDYRESMISVNVVVANKSISLYTLFWRNLCALVSLIAMRKPARVDPGEKERLAEKMDYVYSNLLCTSKKPIGELSMSELFHAMRVMSLRRWQLPWSRHYVRYLVDLEKAVAEYVTWLGGEEDKHLYDEGCKRAKDRPHYGVSMKCAARLADWFYAQKKRTRERMILESWLQPDSIPHDEAALRRLDALLYERAAGVHDAARFLGPLKKLILAHLVQFGEAELYSKRHGNKNASHKDILREFRPTNLIAYYEDELFEVKKVTELLDSPLAVVRQFRELLQLYLINLVFNTTDGCHFSWMNYYVCLEMDFQESYGNIKSNPDPLIIQSFTQWFVYFEAQLWPADSLLHAFLGWAQLLTLKRQSKMHKSMDIRPVLDQIFEEQDDNNNEDHGEQSLVPFRDCMDVSDWI